MFCTISLLLFRKFWNIREQSQQTKIAFFKKQRKSVSSPLFVIKIISGYVAKNTTLVVKKLFHLVVFLTTYPLISLGNIC